MRVDNGDNIPAGTAFASGPELSLPLYAGGLAVTLCGVEAVCSSMGQDPITAAATLLTGLGFAFSLTCRALRISPRAVEIACIALIAYILYTLVNHNDLFGRIDPRSLVVGADKTEDRLAAGLMWCAVLWSWTLVSSENVMFSCVLSAAMIGLIGSVDLNNSTLVWFAGFVLAMTFLLVHQNGLQNRALAPRPASLPGLAPLPGLPPLRMQMALAAACAVLVLVLGLVLVVPMRAMLSSLSLGQAIRHLVGSGHIAVEGAPLVSERFSDDAGLEIGRGSVWPTSSGIVMHVAPSDNAPHYWRGRTYDLYTGTGWQSTRQTSLPLDWQEGTDDGHVYALPTRWITGEGQRLPDAPRRPHMNAQVDVHGDTEQFYYADEPRLLVFDSGFGPGPALAPDGSLDLSGHAVRSRYSISSATPPNALEPDVQARLRLARGPYPLAVRRLYLGSLRSNQNAVTSAADLAYYREAVRRALANAPPSQAPIDRALAIQDWITQQCTYSLSVDPLPAGADHVHTFLARTRRGYCDMFASAMVVLSRTAGIPARLATGFAPGQPDETGTAYNIRALDKHAWAELYFPGSGWLIFDPTVGSRTDGSIPSGSATQNDLWHSVQRLVTASGPLPGLLIFGVLVCLVFVGRTEFTARYRPVSAARPASDVRARTELGRHYQRMTRALAALGLPRRPSETPAEFEARALPLLARMSAETGVALPADALQILTAQFIAARYGGSLGGDTLQSERLASQMANAATRARLAQGWRRLRPR